VLVRLAGLNQGQPWNNIFHLQYAGGVPTSANLTSLLGSVAAAWAANFASLCQAGVTLTELQAADLASPTGATSTLAAAGVGTRAGTAMPTQVALVISWKIDLRYRGGHPRSYLPAAVLADVTSGHLWTTAFVSEAQSAGQGFQGALNAIAVAPLTFVMVAVSFFTQHALRPTPLVRPVVTALVHDRVDTQRRRLGKERV